MTITELLQLAQQRFTQLSKGEHFLLDAIFSGHVADFSNKDDGENFSDEDKELRASIIRWLCVDTQARNYIDVRGIQIQDAIIIGRLDLAFITIPFPLAFVRCTIEKGVDLTESDTKAIAFDGSHCGPITAAQSRIRGSLYLRDGFRAEGEVRLLGATIKGSLECRNADFHNPDGDAISANSLEVSGSVFMDQGFSAYGTIRLTGAAIGKVLLCSGGKFITPHREALALDGLSTGGSVMMEKEFVAVGEVRLMGASIQGDLSCRSGRILNHGSDALSADGLTLSGSANLNRGFRAYGRVRLVGAVIKRDLTCRDSHFYNNNSDTLVIDRARIDGNVYFEGDFTSNGLISLRTTRVGGDVHFWNAEFTGKNLNGVFAENAHIGGKFLWKEITLSENTELNLCYAKADQLADEEQSWPYPGRLHLNGFHYHSISEGPTDAASRMNWLRRQRFAPYQQQPYEHLAKVLRGSGLDEDAIEISIAGEDDRLRYGGLSLINRLRLGSLKYFLDYGYKPQHRALALSTVFVLVGWLLFSIADVYDLMSPTRERVYLDPIYLDGKVMPDEYPVFTPLIYSLDAFIPFVDLHQEEYWLPNANHTCVILETTLPCGKLLRFYHWLHISMGWILATLFAVGLTGLVRKE